MKTISRFRSLGIDDVYFVMGLRQKQLEHVFALCPELGWFGDGWHLLYGSREIPMIMIRPDGLSLIVKINIPKLAWSHNVRLAGPKEIRKAIRTFRTLTGIDLNSGEVLQTDMCYCEGSEVSIHAALQLFTCPKGFTREDQINGSYFNEKKGRVTLNPYDKAEQLRDNGLPIPNEVLAECESLNPHLPRYELRIGNDETGHKVCTELRRLKLWREAYFTGSDLYSDTGFNALTQFYLHFMVEKVLVLPKQASKRNPNSVRTLKTRVALELVDAEAPERYEENAIVLHAAGKLSDEVFDKVLEEVERLQYRQRISRLRNDIRGLGEEILEAHPIRVQVRHAPTPP